MKKLFLVAVLMIVGAACADAQIVFNKWKVKNWIYSTYYLIEVQYTVTGTKPIKYLYYNYYGVNEVGDAIMSNVKVFDQNTVGYYEQKVQGTGPYEPGKKYKRFRDPAFITNAKVKLIPSYLKIVYMDDTEEEFDITRENIGKFFPSVKWVEYKKPEVVQE